MNISRSFNPSYSMANHYFGRKIKLAYFDDLEKNPLANPLFITVDWRCLNFFKRHRGICLLCKKNNGFSFYDLSFCYRREIWVLYISENDQALALQLGHHIQKEGAHTIKVIAFNNALLGSN